MLVIIFMYLISFIYLFKISKKNIHMLQQNFYNENNRYIKWGFKDISRIFKLDIVLSCNLLM